MAQMRWLSLYSNDEFFTLGVNTRRGTVAKAVSTDFDDYKGVVCYKVTGKRTKAVIAWIHNIDRLKQFVLAAYDDLIRRGIIE